METVFLYILITSVIIQIYYVLFIFSRLVRFKAEHQSSRHNIPSPVSVIICAHNEISNLKKLLPKLLNQYYPGYEIIIVDDRSDDGTFKYLKELSFKKAAPLFNREYAQIVHQKEIELKIIRVNKTPGRINPKKHALNLSIKAAKNNILLFTDADCVPISKHWISEMQKRFSNGTEIVLGYSQYYKVHGVPNNSGAHGAMRYALSTMLNSLIRYETLYTAIQYFSFALINKPYMGVGRNLAYKKELFLNNNGFAAHIQHTGGDDDLFVNQAARTNYEYPNPIPGTRVETRSRVFGSKFVNRKSKIVNLNNVAIAINKESQTISKPKENILEWLIQKKRHLAAGKLYKTADIIRLAMLFISQLLFYISVIWLLVSQNFLFTVVICYILRTSLILFTFAQIIKKLSDSTKWYLIPILDILYVVYYFFVGAIVLVSKNTRWK